MPYIPLPIGVALNVNAYAWWVPGAVVGASKVYVDFFNASTGIVNFTGLWAVPCTDVAITGLVSVEIQLYRTSTVGTTSASGQTFVYNSSAVTGSTGWHTVTPYDTRNPALSTGITARALPSTGAGIAKSAFYWAQFIAVEETIAASELVQQINLLPTGLYTQTLTLNSSQGLLIQQGLVAGLGTLAFTGQFTVSTGV